MEGFFIIWKRSTVSCLPWTEEYAGSNPAFQTICSVRQRKVKPPPFQGGVRGSTPLPSTNWDIGELVNPPDFESGECKFEPCCPSNVHYFLMFTYNEQYEKMNNMVLQCKQVEQLDCESSGSQFESGVTPNCRDDGIGIRAGLRNQILRVRVPLSVQIFYIAIWNKMPSWWKWLYTLDLKSNALEDCRFESC